MCCPPPADHRARPIGACHAADIRYSEQATTTRSRCRHLPAALIVASDSLCANSMALGGHAGNDSCKRGGVANRLVQTHDILRSLEAHTDKDELTT